MLLEDMLYDDYFDIYCSVREGGLSNIVPLLITSHFFVRQGCIYVVVSRKFKFAANFARKLIPITFYYSCKNLSDFPIITLITSHFFARQGCIYLQMWAISTFLL